MKHLKSFIIVAILTLSLASSNHTFANSNKPVRGIDVVVLKNPGTNTRQMATPDGHGGYTVDLPGAGSYTISYASGPKKGQVIKKVTVQKAGPVSVSASAAQ